MMDDDVLAIKGSRGSGAFKVVEKLKGRRESTMLNLV